MIKAKTVTIHSIVYNTCGSEINTRTKDGKVSIPLYFFNILKWYNIT